MTLHPLSLRPVALAILAGLALSDVALAGDDDTPLSLSLAHTIQRDSNFSRDDDKQAETINSTAIRAAFDKAYGRQVYRAGAKLSKSRYAHYGDLLNNDGKDVNASVSSGVLADWVVTAGGAYQENLNNIQDNNTNRRVVRNIRKYRDGNLSVQYGNGGLLALVANYDANKLSYSEPIYQFNNANQHSTGLKAIYYSSDLLNFSLGSRLVRTEFPVNRNGENQKDRNIDLAMQYQATGLSNLTAMLTRRNSVYSTDPDRTVRGWTGSLNWTYTPSGLMSYGVGYLRQTGADRTKLDQVLGTTVVSSQNSSNNNVTSTLSLLAKLQATGKLSFSANYGLSRYEIDNRTSGTGAALVNNQVVVYDATSLNQSSSINRNLTLGVDYAATRAVYLGCNVQKYKQTAGANRIGFDGHSFDCTASVTID